MVSSTIARRSAFVRHRFFLAGSPTCCDCVSVSTIPLRGHKHQRPHTHNPHSHSRSTHGENRTITNQPLANCKLIGESCLFSWLTKPTSLLGRKLKNEVRRQVREQDSPLNGTELSPCVALART